MNELLWFLVFFLPAYVGNMMPPFFRRLPWGYPLDCGMTLRGRRLLGENKTWRGIVVGTLGGVLTGWLMQQGGLPFMWWWGGVLGFAALLGDAIKSLFKRQLDIKPGGRWMPFDQLDFLLVAFLASLSFARFSTVTVLLGFVVVFVGTVLVQVLGGVTGVKKDAL